MAIKNIKKIPKSSFKNILLVLLIMICFRSFADPLSDLKILQEAYPGAFTIIDKQSILFPDGTKILYDDGRSKSFEELLENPDLQDMMSLDYPLDPIKGVPLFQDDPGRFRPDGFFRALYGKNEKEVRQHLRSVQWLPSEGGHRLLVNTRFDIDKKLVAIIQELEALPRGYEHYLQPPGGTFNFRVIAGTQRLSMHSFGIALDIAVSPSHYWRWETTGPEVYKNNIPLAIVDIFEKYGFIWGGKWYHFDTMHFEYRPELLLKARIKEEMKRERNLGK